MNYALNPGSSTIFHPCRLPGLHDYKAMHDIMDTFHTCYYFCIYFFGGRHPYRLHRKPSCIFKFADCIKVYWFNKFYFYLPFKNRDFLAVMAFWDRRRQFQQFLLPYAYPFAESMIGSGISFNFQCFFQAILLIRFWLYWITLDSWYQIGPYTGSKYCKGIVFIQS